MRWRGRGLSPRKIDGRYDQWGVGYHRNRQRLAIQRRHAVENIELAARFQLNDRLQPLNAGGGPFAKRNGPINDDKTQ